MLNIRKVDHVGLRVRDKDRSIAFYRGLGFEVMADVGFDQGHPVIMRHASGVVLNLLGPANTEDGVNVLMDVGEKYPGYTHVALEIESIDDAKALFAEKGIQITGSFSFKGMNAIFIRDPDRNVIELDQHDCKTADPAGYEAHP